MLVPLGARLPDDDVQGFVLKGFELPLPGEIDQEVAHLFFVARTPRDLGQFFKEVEYLSWVTIAPASDPLPVCFV